MSTEKINFILCDAVTEHLLLSWYDMGILKQEVLQSDKPVLLGFRALRSVRLQSPILSAFADSRPEIRVTVLDKTKILTK